MKVKHAIRDKPDATYVRLGVQPLFFRHYSRRIPEIRDNKDI